jgi:hypothetical protein
MEGDRHFDTLRAFALVAGVLFAGVLVVGVGYALLCLYGMWAFTNEVPK